MSQISDVSGAITDCDAPPPPYLPSPKPPLLPPSPPPSPPPPILPLQVHAGDNLTNSLLEFRSFEHAGLPVHLVIGGAHHLGHAAAHFDATTAVSEVWLEGNGSVAELIGDGLVLLLIANGAPPVNIEGIIFRGHVHIESSSVNLHNCSFLPGALGSRRGLKVSGGIVNLQQVRMASLLFGALEVFGGLVVITDSRFTFNIANFGAAILMHGGVLTLIHCVFDQNSATEAGGAVAINGGSVLLSNQTVLQQNTAPQGSNLYINSSSAHVTYGLPAPLGHWIAQPFLCKEYRVPCAAGAIECVEEEQQLLVDQPCDWHTNPMALGLTMAAFGKGPFDDDYPLTCPASSYGNSFDIVAQSQPACAGVCPEVRTQLLMARTHNSWHSQSTCLSRRVPTAQWPRLSQSAAHLGPTVHLAAHHLRCVRQAALGQAEV